MSLNPLHKNVLLRLAMLFLLFALSAEAGIKTRYYVPFSQTATFEGNIEYAFYVTDSGQVRQYDRNCEFRWTIDLTPGQTLSASDNGKFYALVGPDSTNPARLQYTVHNARHQILSSGGMSSASDIYISNSGRYVVAERALGNARAVLISFDSLGAEIGKADVSHCDRLIFAPGERGYLVDVGESGTHNYFFSGEKIGSYPAGERISYSISGRRVVIYRKGFIYLYLEDSLISAFKAKRPAVIELIYDDQHGRVFALSPKWIHIINARTGSAMLEYPTTGEKYQFVDFDYSPEAELLAVTIQKSYGSTVKVEERANQNGLRIFTVDGEEMPYYSIVTTGARRGYPIIQFATDGVGALVVTADQIHKVGW